MPKFIPPGTGWHRDIPDPRDYVPSDPRVGELLRRLKRPRGARKGLPARVDWREFCSPVGDQQRLDSCSASSCLGLVEYFERRASGRSIEGSALFLYKMARELRGRPGDSGADLRTTLKAMVRFGIPPERHCPYNVVRFDDDPLPLLFSYADAFRPIRYVRLDPPASRGPESLETMKSFLAAGFPSALGFPLLASTGREADIPAPTVFDAVRGGHAVVAVGYDDKRRIRSTKGALLVRNSWGEGWGEGGYGWLPYAYVEGGLAVDIWTLLNTEWLGSGEFEHPL
jgi:C1A family cysteine protease